MQTGARAIRVLLVDDEVEFLASMKTSLQRRGFKVGTATDGKSGLALFASERFDVVVLDVKMPGLGGEEVFREIRRKQPTVPVIMLTGHGTIQQAFQTSKEGVFEYVAKPCEVEVLVELLCRATSSEMAQDTRVEEEYGGAPRVLLVDDEVELLDSLSRALERRGMDVSVAPDAAKALAQLGQRVFDVVVLDMRMPGMGGMEVLERIKKAHPLTEVLVLTGHPSSEMAVQATKLGAFDFLMKPIKVEQLAERIGAAREERRERLEEERLRRVSEILKQRPD